MGLILAGIFIDVFALMRIFGDMTSIFFRYTYTAPFSEHEINMLVQVAAGVVLFLIGILIVYFVSKNAKKEKSSMKLFICPRCAGILTAMQFIKVEYSEYEVVIFAWVQVGVGSVNGKEIDLSGATGAIPKKKLKRRIEKIETAIKAL